MHPAHSLLAAVVEALSVNDGHVVLRQRGGHGGCVHVLPPRAMVFMSGELER